MYLIVTPSQKSTWFGTIYCRSFKLYAEAEEHRILRSHKLTRVTLWVDALRDEYAAAAAAAHDRAKQRGLFVSNMSDTAVITANELTALYKTIRSLNACSVSIADLCRGVDIKHRSLRALEDLTTSLIAAIDNIDAAIRAARAYEIGAEEIYAPGDDEDKTVPPAEWTRGWRR